MNRRRFATNVLSMAGALFVSALARPSSNGISHRDDLGVREDGWITDVEGIKVGHFTDQRRPTGCTVVMCEPEGACASPMHWIPRKAPATLFS
jgi:hypothetical protein